MPYAIGDKVVITRAGTYKEVPQGATGVVRSEYLGKLAIIIDGIPNPRSSYNCFYFTTRCVKHINEKEKKIMEGNYHIVQVKFLEGSNANKVHHCACYDLSMTAGDICVVKSANHGLGIAQIVEISDKTDEEITREIICKCDFSDYYKREAIRERKAELVKLMHSRADELREIALFKALAANDESMAAMLNEYSELEGAM